MKCLNCGSEAVMGLRAACKLPYKDKLCGNCSRKMSKEVFCIKYGDDIGPIEHEKYCKSRGMSLQKFQKKYGEQEGLEKYDQWKKKCSEGISEQYYLNKFGEDGKLIWEKQCASKDTNSYEFFLKKYKDEEIAKQKYDERNKINSAIITKRNKDLIWTDEMRRNIGLHFRYVNSIEYFEEKYGIDAEEEYRKHNAKHAVTLESMIKKYGREEAEIRYTNWLISISGNSRGSHSKISEELFDQLYQRANDNSGFKYGKLNKEYMVKVEFGKYYLYDFVDLNTKKCIEFNGDYWHANPKKYKSTHKLKLPRKIVEASEIWDKDKEKNKCIENEGFEVLIVWESDYLKDKEKTILKCLEFIEGI